MTWVLTKLSCYDIIQKVKEILCWAVRWGNSFESPSLRILDLSVGHST